MQKRYTLNEKRKQNAVRRSMNLKAQQSKKKNSISARAEISSFQIKGLHFRGEK